MPIKFLNHNQIDKHKWNLCIKSSFNEIIYAYSWYLDIVSENWDALVLNDYKAVMPLTKKTRYGINYLSQPLFTQQLGVFSVSNLNSEIIDIFIQSIPKKIKYAEINFNIFNRIDNTKHHTKSNTNFELDLISQYPKLRSGFSKNTKRNIAKAGKNNISFNNNITPYQLINLFKNNVGDSRNNFDDNDYSMLRKLIQSSLQYKMGEIWGAYTAENNLCAATFFIYSKQKAIYLVSASTAEGIEKRAMFGLVDNFIQKNAERALTLDFEGSNIESIARFFKGFGATACEYQSLKINRLPWFIRLFKK